MRKHELRQITIIAKDRIGLLAEIAGLLGRNGININSISGDRIRSNAIMRIMTDDFEKSREVLRKAGYKVVESNTIIISIEDKPGELAKIATRLAKAGVNIENMFMLDKIKNKSILAMRVDDYEKAHRVL